MGDPAGTAVLELRTDSATLFDDLDKVKQELKGVADVADATGQAATADWAMMAKAISSVANQLAEQKAKTKEVHDHTQEMGEGFKDLVGTLKEVAGAFGIAFSVDFAIEFLRSIAEEAEALRNLSAETQINVEDLQVLRAATKEYGVDADTLARALFNLKMRIAGGDESVASAYALMGISIDQVRDKDAMALFIETERGLGTLQGAIRDTAASDLYGMRLGHSLLALSTGIDDAIEKARHLNTVASEESVRAAAEYATAIERAKDNLHAWVVEMEGSAAIGFNALSKALDSGASKWKVAKAMLDDYVLSSVVGVQTGANLAKVLDDANVAAEKDASITKSAAGAHREASAALDAHGQAARFMATLELNSTKPLLEWQVEYLGHLKDIGQLTAANAAKIGVNVQQFDKYKAGLEAAKKAAEDLAKAEAEADAIALTRYANEIKSLQQMTAERLKAYGFAGQIAQLEQLDAMERLLAHTVGAAITSEKDRAKVREEAITRHIELMNQEMAVQEKQKAVVNAAIEAEFQAQAKLNAEWGLTAAGALQVQTTAAETLRIELDKLHVTKVEGISQAAQEQVLMDAFTKALYDEAVAQDAATSALAKHSDEVARANTETRQLTITVAASAEQLYAYYEALSLMGPFGTPQGIDSTHTGPGNLGSGSLEAALRRIGVHRASGGPASAGMPYIVGDAGRPELFVPDRNGTILPSVAGAVVVNVTINGSVLSDKDEIARVVGDAVEHRMRLTGRWPSGA